MDKVVGVVGVGIMGSAMARNLLKDGFRVIAYDVSDAAVRAVEDAGGEAARSPRDVAERAPIIITSVPSVAALAAAASGNDGLATAKGEGQIIVECSTLPLEAKQEVYEALRARGKTMLDCPVSGTGAQAAKKDLVVFGSGDRAAYDACRAVFGGMSRAQKYLGEFGNGSKMKFIANHLVTVHNVAAAEAMVLGMKAGLDPHQVVDLVGPGAGNSRVFELRAPMMADNAYEPATMKVSIWQKDMAIIGRFAAELGCPTPLLSATEPIYASAMATGHEAHDTAAVCAVLEAMAGIDRTGV